MADVIQDGKGIIIHSIFMLIPFAMNIGMSFTNYSAINPNVRFIGLENYKNLLSDASVWSSIKNTFVFIVGVLVFTMLLGIFYALVMSMNIRGINVLKAIILLPWVIPEPITANVWKWIFSADSGIVYNILLRMHLISEGASFFMDPNLAMLLIILSNSWRTAPFVAVMVYAKLRSIPTAQLEAANIDGANSIQTFFYITIPWLSPILARCCMLLFIWSFNSFTIIYILTFGGPFGATTTLPFLIRQLGFDRYSFGQAASLSVIALLIIGVVAMVGWLMAKLLDNLSKGRRQAI